MNRTIRPSIFAAVAALMLAALPASAAQTAAPTSPPVTEHVIIISVDGLRPDAIRAFDAQTMQRLIRQGAYSLQAQTILPSKTLPSHTSMLTGVTPEVHGITWNEDRSGTYGVVRVPTIFELARAQGLQTAAFFSKPKFHHLQIPGSLDYTQAPRGGYWMATRTVNDAARYLQHERPNLLFVHIAETDYAGHALGWMSFAYGLAVGRADAAVDLLLQAADQAFGRGDYTVILTADHGGHGRDHGSADPRDTTIPWIAWGEGVEPGRLGPGIRTMDTAATALWLLGVPVPERWAGEPVRAAFVSAAPAAMGAAANSGAEPRSAAASHPSRPRHSH